MALNDALRDFSKKPLGFRIGVMAAGVGVIALLYWQLFYSDMSDELKGLKATNAKLQQKHKKLIDREKEYKKLVKQNEQLKEQLIKNRVSLPTSSELPSFFVHLQKQAAQSGASIRKWSRAREVPVGFYVKVPVSISISGTYHQILHYFKLLAQTDRIITVENLKLGGATRRNDETVLTASFAASTFRVADAAGDNALFGGPEKEADKGKKKSSKVGDARKKREADVAKRLGEKPSAKEATDAAKAANKAVNDKTDKGVNRMTNPGAGGVP